jgi:hypothetical protein
MKMIGNDNYKQNIRIAKQKCYNCNANNSIKLINITINIINNTNDSYNLQNDSSYNKKVKK